jgi:hypothetical protein
MHSRLCFRQPKNHPLKAVCLPTGAYFGNFNGFMPLTFYPSGGYKIEGMAMNKKFDEREATQIACRIVEKYGGHIDYYRLVKLLYVVERRAWQELKCPAMGGTYFSLPKGPIISEAVNACKQQDDFPFWAEHLCKQPRGSGSCVKLLKPSGRDEISDALLQLVDAVISETRSWDNKKLAAYVHQFKEFENPGEGKRKEIPASRIVAVGGLSQEEITKLEAEFALWNKLEEALA